MNKEQQEIMYKLSMFEQQMQQLQHQLQVVEESIIDLGSLSVGLDEIEKSYDKEILAPLGRGIFVKAKLLSKDLTVDVGGKTFVKKGIPETKEIIENQTEKLKKIKKDIKDKTREIDEELRKVLNEAQNLETDEN